MQNYDFKFGVNRDNDPRLGIHKGRITLSDRELEPLFDEVIQEILKSCLNTLIGQKTEVISHIPPSYTLLMSSSMSFSSVGSQSHHMCEELFVGSWGNTRCKPFRLEIMRK